MKPEATLHRAVADFLRAALPDDVVWSTLDHARHGARYGAQLKARGVARGLPDILLLVPQNSWQPPLTVGLELKASGGRPSPDQLVMQKRWQQAGALYTFEYSIEGVEKLLRTLGVKLRATVGDSIIGTASRQPVRRRAA